MPEIKYYTMNFSCDRNAVVDLSKLPSAKINLVRGNHA